jgi:hypothetical protein
MSEKAGQLISLAQKRANLISAKYWMAQPNIPSIKSVA